MIAKASIKVGGENYVFEFENAVEMEALHRAIAVSNYPTYCNLCKKEVPSDELKLTTNKDQEGNIYVNLKHEVCRGKVKLGQYKQGGYFWHREFEKYVPKDSVEKEKGNGGS